MKNRIGWLTLILCLLVGAFHTWAAETDSSSNWPYEITTDKGIIIIYQPQPEKQKGNTLRARAAVAIETKESPEPVFGVVWFEANLNSDQDLRIAEIENIKVQKISFPNQDEKKAQKLADILEKDLSDLDLQISMENLVATLETAENRVAGSQKINTDPPVIIFSKEPAVLVLIDGDPIMKPEEGSDIMRVLNTAYTLLFKQKEKTYYLFADKDAWYRADDIKGEWTLASSVPSDIEKLAPKQEDDTLDENEPREEEKASEPGPNPKIIVAIKPTELISCTGDPEFTPISGTDLLYVSNTDSDVLLDVNGQIYYILLAGRWFSSKSTDGPWTYIAGDKLPSDFSKIPEESDMGTVLYSIPETDVAKEAALETMIPQTAVIDRKATLNVEYDGDPKFEKITGTSMTYAVNTATPIILVNKEYYACDQAVWFVNSKATGTWKVATKIPDEIYSISPESPLYNVTFVRIYQVTDDEVIYGYTSGYNNTYVYNTTIVYGSGHHHHGWCGRYYYPYPSTWGFHVRYNPWSGWSFGLSYSYGPFRFTIGGGGWYRGGWWGPGRYRGYNRGYRHGYRRGSNAGYKAGYRQGRRNSAKRNMYNSQGNKTRVKPSSPTNKNKARVAGKSDRTNNVFADSQGNVHRKTDQGWEKNTQNGWKPESSTGKPSQKPSQQPTQIKSNKSNTSQQLNKSHQARQRGNNQTNKSRSTRGSGRPRGGGRR